MFFSFWDFCLFLVIIYVLSTDRNFIFFLLEVNVWIRIGVFFDGIDI